MRKLCFILLYFLSVVIFTSCKKSVDYLGYVSERRQDIYLYSDDTTKIKIYVSERESPYANDGIKGEMSPFAEIFVTLPQNYDEVEISVCNIEGQMNYKATDNCYYLSLSDSSISGERVEVTLTCDDKSEVFTAASVKDDGVISCDGAILCVIEHDKEIFKSLTKNNMFYGEIYVRLLYDDGCYYYVGVCDRQQKISAYLVDGKRGKIIATKKL